MLGVIITILLTLITIYLVYLSIRKGSQPKPVEKPVPKIKEEKVIASKPEKHKKPQKTIPMPMESAEFSMNVGSSTPLCMSFSENGEYIIVPLRNRYQVLFSIESLTEKKSAVARYKLVDDNIVDCKLLSHPSLQVVFALDRSKSIRSFILDPINENYQPGKFSIMNASKIMLDKIVVPCDLSYVAALGDETYLSVFLPDGKPLFRTDTRQVKNEELSVSSDSDFFAASSSTAEIVAYGIRRGRDNLPQKIEKAFSVSGHRNLVRALHFHPAQKQVVTGSDDGTIRITQTPHLWSEGDNFVKPLGSFDIENKEPAKFVRISSNDSIAVLTESQKLLIYQREKLVKTIKHPHNEPISQIEWTPDGKYIVVLSTSSPFIYSYANPC